MTSVQKSINKLIATTLANGMMVTVRPKGTNTEEHAVLDHGFLKRHASQKQGACA